MTSVVTVTELFPELAADELERYLDSVSPPAPRASAFGPEPPASLALAPRDSEALPFSRLMEAVEDHLCAVSTDAGSSCPVAETPAKPLDAAAADLRRRLLHESTLDFLMRPLIDAMGRARKLATLNGATSHERYHDFQEQVAADLVAFLDTYSVAWQALIQQVTAADDFLSELTERLTTDWDLICTSLGIDPADAVAHLEAGGDGHNGGRRVTVVTTKRGKKFVYKPRSIDGEAAFARLATELTNLGFRQPAAHVVRRDGYGYMEFVVESHHPDPVVLAGQTGRLAALLYALNCRDIHFENVIVDEAGPMPIDLESILHPHRLDAKGAANPPTDAHQLLDESVYGVGVLPLVVLGANGSEGYYDLGFLGRGRVVAGGAYRQHHVVNAFTDEMRCVFAKPSTEGEAHDVPLEEVRACSDAFTEHFAMSYRWILENRESVWAATLAAFTGSRLRYLHNPTMLYTQVLRTLNSAPAASSEKLTHLLAMRIGLGSLESPRLVSAEVASLLARDVPYFTVVADSPHVFAESSDTSVGDLVASPLAMVKTKLESMSESALEGQLRLIRIAFCATVSDEGMEVVGGSVPNEAQPFNRPTDVDPGHAWIDLARDVADDIASRMVADRFDHLPHTWLGPLAAIDGDRPWPPGVLGYDLYTGRLGVALALARAARALDDEPLARKVSQLFDTSAVILDGETYVEKSLGPLGRGAYTGVTGVLWALWAAGRALDRPDWCQVAARSFTGLWNAAEIEPDSKLLDTMAGTTTALRVAQMMGVSAPALTHAREQVTAALIRQDGWPLFELADQSGFAHGLSGVLFYTAATGDSTLEPAARELTARIGEFWEPDAMNWHTNTKHNRLAHGWCHGRAGVTLGLAAAARTFDIEDPRWDIDDLTARVAAEGSGYNLTYCHGDLGNFDTLRWLTGGKRVADLPILANFANKLTVPAVRAKLGDRHSRYSLNDGLLAGRAGVLLHAAERVDTSMWISPLTLEVRTW